MAPFTHASQFPCSREPLLLWSDSTPSDGMPCSAVSSGSIRNLHDTKFEFAEVSARAGGFPSDSSSKESACNAGDLGSILGQEDTLEKAMATHSSILAWIIPWTEEPGGPQSRKSQRLGHD